MWRLLLTVVVAAWSAGAAACGPQVRVQFVEASPDRFEMHFVRGPKLTLQALSIHLAGSAAGAVFDNYGGLEIQGAQPNPQGVAIRSITYPPGPDESVRLTFEGFSAGRAATVHTDLDDLGRTGDQDQNHIADRELDGATAEATLLAEDGRTVRIDGRFDDNGHALLGNRGCV